MKEVVDMTPKQQRALPASMMMADVRLCLARAACELAGLKLAEALSQ
jgi:hypothetical protein